MGGAGMVERLAARYPRLTVGWTPTRESGAWYDLARKLRLGIDYLRFLDPRYAAAPRLRGRAEERTPGGRALACRPAAAPHRIRAAAARRGSCTSSSGRFRAAASSTPSCASRPPDVVLITPLVDLGSPQLDHYLSARALGLRTVLVRRELGSPVEQVAAPRRARPGDRLERDAEAGSDRASRRAAGPGRRDRRAMLRPVVRAARRRGRGRSSASSSASTRRSRSSSTSARRSFATRPARRDSSSSGSQPCAAARDPAAARGRHPGPAAPGPPRRVAADRSDRVQERRVLRQPSRRSRLEERLLRLLRPRRRRSSDSTPAPSSKPASPASRCSPSCCRRSPKDNQEGTLHFHYLMDVGRRPACSRRAASTSTSRSSRPRSPIRRRGIERARRFTEAFIRPQGLDSPSTPRFAERHRSGRHAAGAGAGGRAADRAGRTCPAPALARLRAAPLPSRSRCGRKRTTRSAASAATSRSRCS